MCCPNCKLGAPIRFAAVLLAFCASWAFSAESASTPAGKSGTTATSDGGISRRIISTTEPSTPPARPPAGPNDTVGKKRPVEVEKAAPMNLPRLSAKHPEKLDKKKFTVDALKVPAGATGTRKLSQRGIDYLDLDPNKTWARSLRGSPKDVVFISFCVNASIGTEFELAGALLRVAASKEAGKVQVQARVPDAKKPGAFVWKSVGIRTAIDTFNGRSLAPLPVFTARLDPAAGAWDLFLGSRQLAAGMKITDETKSNARKFRLRAGGAGAQLCALVISDDNPLFTDTNANGVEDGFEQNSNGALLSKHSTEAEKKNVASAWRAAQKGRNGGNIGAKRPAPDRVALTARTK